MANGIIYGTTNRHDVEVKLTWASIPDVSLGRSKVVVNLLYRKTSEGILEGEGTFFVNGLSVSRYLILGSGSWVKALSTELIVEYGDKETKELMLIAAGTITSDGSIVISRTECEATVILDRIPGPSVIERTADVLIGKRCFVSWMPRATTFSYRLIFSLGDWREETALICPDSTALFTYTDFVIPYEAARALPEAVQGRMTVSLLTFRDREASVLAGEHSVDFTVTVPQTEETLPSFSVNFSTINQRSGFDGVWMQGVTGVSAVFSDENAKYGASIRDRSLYVEGARYRAPYRSAAFQGNGPITLTATVTDSRGFSREISETVNVIAYRSPYLIPVAGMNELICARCLEDGTLSSFGTFLRVRVSESHSSVIVDGEEKNFSRIYLSCRENDADAFGDRIEISGDDILAEIVPSVRKSYLIKLSVVDTVGSEGAVLITVSTDIVAFHLGEGGRRAAFGKYAETEDCLDIDSSWDVHGRVLGLGSCNRNLAKGDDLDIFTVPGTYGIPDEETAATLLNAPFPKAGKMTVSFADGTGNRLLQEYVDITGTARGVRLIENGVCREWSLFCDTGWKEAAPGIEYRGLGEKVSLRFSFAVQTDGLPIVFEKVLPSALCPRTPRFCLCACSMGIVIAAVEPNGTVEISRAFSFSDGGELTVDGYAEYLKS